MHIDEALGISFAESFLREQRVMMMQAERCAFERFACEQVLVSPEGEETYPAFFFDELLSFYEKEGSEEPFSLDAERCFVFQRGEEYLFDNLLIQEESEGASLCAEAAGKSKELPVLVVPKVIRGMLSEDAKSNLILPRTQLHYCKPIQAVSPSDIEAYVMCPYRWFIERRINPKKLDFERGSLEQGVFVHEMFADLYRIMKEDYSLSRVTEANFEQVSKIFNTLFEQKLKEQTEDDSAHYVLESELDIIEGEHLKETLLASLEQQARMLPSYVPACHEKALTVSDGILYAGVPLIGRVDRVDVSSVFLTTKETLLITRRVITLISKSFHFLKKFKHLFMLKLSERYFLIKLVQAHCIFRIVLWKIVKLSRVLTMSLFLIFLVLPKKQVLWR